MKASLTFQFEKDDPDHLVDRLVRHQDIYFALRKIVEYMQQCHLFEEAVGITNAKRFNVEIQNILKNHQVDHLL